MDPGDGLVTIIIESGNHAGGLPPQLWACSLVWLVRLRFGGQRQNPEPQSHFCKMMLLPDLLHGRVV